MVETKNDLNSNEAHRKEGILRDLQVIPADHTLISYTRIFEGRGAEGFVSGNKITTQDVSHQQHIVYLREKSLVSIAGGLEFKAQMHFKRMRFLEELGVPVLKGYGVHGATIFEEFIPNDQTEYAMKKIKGPDIDDEGRTYLDQLIDMSLRFDIAGYEKNGLIRESMFDGDKKRFVVYDAGADLGEPTGAPCSNNLRSILSQFPRERAYILDQYDAQLKHLEVPYDLTRGINVTEQHMPKRSDENIAAFADNIAIAIENPCEEQSRRIKDFITHSENNNIFVRGKEGDWEKGVRIFWSTDNPTNIMGTRHTPFFDYATKKGGGELGMAFDIMQPTIIDGSQNKSRLVQAKIQINVDRHSTTLEGRTSKAAVERHAFAMLEEVAFNGFEQGEIYERTITLPNMTPVFETQ